MQANDVKQAKHKVKRIYATVKNTGTGEVFYHELIGINSSVSDAIALYTRHNPSYTVLRIEEGTKPEF